MKLPVRRAGSSAFTARQRGTVARRAGLWAFHRPPVPTKDEVAAGWRHECGEHDRLHGPDDGLAEVGLDIECGADTVIHFSHHRPREGATLSANFV